MPAAAGNIPCCCCELTLSSDAVNVGAISFYQTTLRSQLEILWRVSSRRTYSCYSVFVLGLTTDGPLLRNFMVQVV